MSNQRPPVSPISVELRIGAETRNDLVRRLRGFADDLERNQLSGRGAWGGAGTNGDYVLTLVDKTPEQYRAELHDWSMVQRKLRQPSA